MKKLTDVELVRCIETAGFKSWDSRMWPLMREIIAEFCRINGLTAEAAEQREQGQEIKCGWCKYCGEGVTTFCRGRSEVCAMGLKKIQKPTPPAGLPDGWIDSVKEAIRALEVYESLPRHSYPGPPTTALAGLRAMLSAAPQPAAQTQEREAGE